MISPSTGSLRPSLTAIDQLAVLSCPCLCLSGRSMYAYGSFNQHSLVSVSPVLCFWPSSPQFLFTGGTLPARYVNLDADYCAVLFVSQLSQINF